MTNERIKEILLEIQPCDIEFSVIQTGKESKRVNGFYKPDTHEIFIHNLNLKSDNMLVYTAIHEYTHHLVTVEKLAQNPAANCAGGCKVHTQEFWAKFGDLLAVAEQKGFSVSESLVGKRYFVYLRSEKSKSLKGHYSGRFSVSANRAGLRKSGSVRNILSYRTVLVFGQQQIPVRNNRTGENTCFAQGFHD